MLLQTVRPNIVQAIRAYRVDDLMRAAQDAGHHFLYANVTDAQSKQEVLEQIAQAFLFPSHFGKNLDALHDCMTDAVNKAGSQRGFVVVLEQLPDNRGFDREAREQLLDVFRDAADFWAERKIPFRCFYSFAVSHSDNTAWDKVAETPAPIPEAKVKPAAKTTTGPTFSANMPMMSSAFDTAMWLNAA